MTHDIFISYSSIDKQTADAICHVLEANKLKCWIAPRNVHAGRNYAEQIMYGIKEAKIVVLVFSKNSQESNFVNNEIDTAFSNNKPILSFKIDETMPENKMGFYLKNKHWLDAYPHPEDVFEKLVTDAYLLCDEDWDGEFKNPNQATKTEQKTKQETAGSQESANDFYGLYLDPMEDDGSGADEPIEEEVQAEPVVEESVPVEEVRVEPELVVEESVPVEEVRVEPEPVVDEVSKDEGDVEAAVEDIWQEINLESGDGSDEEVLVEPVVEEPVPVEEVRVEPVVEEPIEEKTESKPKSLEEKISLDDAVVGVVELDEYPTKE